MYCVEADKSHHPLEEEMGDQSQAFFGMDVVAADQDCRTDGHVFYSPEVSTAERIDNDSEIMCTSPKGSSVEENEVASNGGAEFQSSKSFCFMNNGVDIDGEHGFLNLKVTSVDNHGMDTVGELNDRSTEVSTFDKHDMYIDGKLECQSPHIPSDDISGSGPCVKGEADIYVLPELGMEFESEDHAYKCYNKYAALKGFSIRKDFVNKSRISGLVVSRRYTCYKQGYRPVKHVGNVKKPRKDTRTGCLAHMTIARQPNGKYRVTHFETEHNHDFATPITAHLLPSQRRISFAQAVESQLANNSAVDGVPKLGMGFDSEDCAYEFYNAYAGRIGFSVRKDYVNRSKIDGAVASRRFTCFREGFRQKDKCDLTAKRSRKETRIGCLAQLIIARQPDGKYRITHFEENHNHELVHACRVRMLRSQKRLAAFGQAVESSAVDGSKMQSKSVSELICQSIKDQGNYGCPITYEKRLPCKRSRDMKQGEAENILQYFQSKQLKDPSFFYSVQLDAEDEITNVFWADAKMLVDYGDFGDVVCFDTTYRLNIYGQPFAPFIGVNHHKQLVIFGAALLYNETFESFKWLFQTFVDAMSGKKPKTMLTDQDAIIADAINLVLPETQQRLCVWHVYQNAVKHLGQVIVDSDSLANDLSSCIFYHDEDEDFVSAWKAMADMYDLCDDEWFCEIFKEREKWAIPYRRQIFCADIARAQLSENFNTSLRKYPKSDLDVLQFFKHFTRVVNDWRYKELEANYDMGQHMPKLMGDIIILKHARDVYTPTIFELFQREYESCLNILVNQCTENGSLFEYKVSFYGQLRQYMVIFNSSDDSVICNCMKFQFTGVLCSHSIKVLDYRNIKMIPAQYILKRWTKDARV